MSLSLAAEARRFPIRGAFTISRGSRTEAAIVEARISDGTQQGRGECVPYARYNETIDSVIEQIESIRQDLAHGLDRKALQGTLPAGAARNALDCAFWDLEARRAGCRVWELDAYRALGGLPPEPMPSAYTLSLEDPDTMREKARENAHRPILKIKLGSRGDLERLVAVREGAPEARIVVDANEGWDVPAYGEMVPRLRELGVELVEQPLPVDLDEALVQLDRPVPLCADEACHDRASLPRLAGRYDVVNIKLDKAGGLTEALALRRAAEEAGFRIMVGCMIGSSLGIAPAVLVASGAAMVDLDAPLLLAEDRDAPITYRDMHVQPPEPGLWG